MQSTKPQADGKTGWIGARIRRHEDQRLLTGAGRFVDDFNLHGQLHCSLVRATIAHGRILSIDSSAAAAMDGVVKIVSGVDVREHWEPLLSSGDMPGLRTPTVYALPTDKVHFYGQAVAAVVATSPECAEDAAARVTVSYERLPPVLNAEQALSTGGEQPRALLYEDWPDNVQLKWTFDTGGVDAALASAAVVISESMTSQRYSGVPLEPRGVLADFDPRTGELTVRMSTQTPHQTKTIIARLLRLEEFNVRVLAEDVGGGFGNKVFHDTEYIPMLLAVLLGRPVKWIETRSEALMTAPHARDYVQDIEAAFSTDGRLLALRERLAWDIGCDGAVRTGGIVGPAIAGSYGPGPYRVAAYSADVTCFVTNKAPQAPYRGVGKDTVNIATERVLDLAAAALDLDPIEIRRRNLIDAYPYQMCSGPIIESGSLRETLDDLVEEMDLQSLREDCQRNRAAGRLRGVGIVSFLEPSGASVPASFFSGFESATVRLAPSGAVTVLSGTQLCGQGAQTALAQVAAERLGCDPLHVRVVTGDTGVTPYGLGAYSSRGAMFGATSVHLAAGQVRDKVLLAASQMLEAAPGDLALGEGAVFVQGSPDKRIPLKAVANAVYFQPGPYAMLPGVDNPTLEATASWTSPAVAWLPDERGQLKLYPAHGGGAQGALVEVDAGTGQIRIERIWVSDDAGTMINPMIVEGQIMGGMLQGIGGTLTEAFTYSDDGTPLARTYRDYGIPTIRSAPSMQLSHMETPSTNPLGTKGVGEAGCIGTPACLMTAVEDALRPLGVKVLNLPLTPPRVLAAIQASRAGRAAVI